MKLIKKITSSVLAMACVLAAAGCEESAPPASSQGTTTAVPTTTASTTKATMKEEDAEAVATIDIGAKKLENGTVKFLASWDINPAEGSPVPVQLEMFQTQYGGSIEHIHTTFEERYTKLATLIQADDAPDMFSADDMDVFPKGAMSGMFEPLDEYVDFDSELWLPLKTVNDQFSFEGKHYVGVYNTDSQCVMFYNKKTIEENGLQDPAKLLEEGNWTWDTFMEMMLKFCNREEGKFATDGWWFEGAFSLTCGKPYIGMENGEIVHNLDTQPIDKVQEFMLNMKNYDLPLPQG